MLTEIINKDIDVNEIFEYVNSCDLVYIGNGSYTKSIYYKDNDENITVFIYSYLHGTSTVLATVRGTKINLPVPLESFNNLFNKNKIFIR